MPMPTPVMVMPTKPMPRAMTATTMAKAEAVGPTACGLGEGFVTPSSLGLRLARPVNIIVTPRALGQPPANVERADHPAALLLLLKASDMPADSALDVLTALKGRGTLDAFPDCDAVYRVLDTIEARAAVHSWRDAASL